jgi:flagellar L-ring protein precursor FlgH
MKIAALAALLSGIALTGCSSVREAKISESFQMNYDEVVPTKEVSPDGAIYSRSNAGFFLGDRRAQRVGDVLTVKLAENLNATKALNAAGAKNNSIAMTLPNALFGGGALNIPALRDGGANLAASNTSTTTGTVTADQSNTITGDITVIVTRVYENGNLWIQGQKMLSVNQGEEYVRVSGVIRPEDIQAGNVVSSTKIAQAQITYTGAGDLNDNTKQGWFGRMVGALAPL